MTPTVASLCTTDQILQYSATLLYLNQLFRNIKYTVHHGSRFLIHTEENKILSVSYFNVAKWLQRKYKWQKIHLSLVATKQIILCLMTQPAEILSLLPIYFSCIVTDVRIINIFFYSNIKFSIYVCNYLISCIGLLTSANETTTFLACTEHSHRFSCTAHGRSTSQCSNIHALVLPFGPNVCLYWCTMVIGP